MKGQIPASVRAKILVFSLTPLLQFVVPNLSPESGVSFIHKFVIGSLFIFSLLAGFLAIVLPLKLSPYIGFDQERLFSLVGLLRWGGMILEFNVLPATASILGLAKQAGRLFSGDNINQDVIFFLMGFIGIISFLSFLLFLYGFITRARDDKRKNAGNTQ
jgi:hypothetical protein